MTEAQYLKHKKRISRMSESIYAAAIASCGGTDMDSADVNAYASGVVFDFILGYPEMIDREHLVTNHILKDLVQH